MDKDKILKILIEFFIDSFKEDPEGVGDWYAQGDEDNFDEFYEEVKKLNK